MEVWRGTFETKGNVSSACGYWIDHRRLKRNTRRLKQGKSVKDPRQVGSAWIYGPLPGQPAVTLDLTGAGFPAHYEQDGGPP